MGLYRFTPPSSGRMGTLWTLASIRGAALLEFGCMGHLLYSHSLMERAGVPLSCSLYSTHLNETDIALGRTDRLDEALDVIIRKDGHRVVFLLPSSIPEIIGVDLAALCQGLREQYPEALLLPFGHGGLDATQHQGVRGALLRLVESLADEPEQTMWAEDADAADAGNAALVADMVADVALVTKAALTADATRASEAALAAGQAEPASFNIIGSCADLFRFKADAREVERMMAGAFGMTPLCIMTSDCSVEQIRHMGDARVNLVIRHEGEAAARCLQERFGTPFVIGRPYGAPATTRWIRQVAQAGGLPVNERFLARENEESQALSARLAPVFSHLANENPRATRLSIGGHIDVVRGILAFANEELGISRGLCWCDDPEVGTEGLPFLTEHAWSNGVVRHGDGLLMASGEALSLRDRNAKSSQKLRGLQIANPDLHWRVNPYEPPFLGFRGALNLLDFWLNAGLAYEQDTRDERDTWGERDERNRWRGRHGKSPSSSDHTKSEDGAL